jgi:septation ring formation regulator EzrA
MKNNGINYDTELVNQIKKIDTTINLSKRDATSCYGINNFMNNLYTTLQQADESFQAIAHSYSIYNKNINEIPLPKKIEDIEIELGNRNDGRIIE